MELLKLSLCLLLVLICDVVFTNGAVSVGKGPCPGGRQSGDKWYPPGCQRCTCYEDSFGCASCGSFQIEIDMHNCYTKSNNDKPYPECCLPTVLCRGDEGFDETLLSAPAP